MGIGEQKYFWLFGTAPPIWCVFSELFRELEVL
jgi:hypothetical protein